MNKRTHTLLLFPPLAPVADLDSAHTDNDGHNEEEDASNQTSCDRPPLHILRHGISEDNLGYIQSVPKKMFR